MSKLEGAPPADAVPLIRMSAITKRFGRVIALRDVQFELRSNEVHVLAVDELPAAQLLELMLGRDLSAPLARDALLSGL